MIGNRTYSSVAARAAIVLALIAAAGPVPARPRQGRAVEAVDPFYLNLLDEGRMLYQNGDPAAAIENLTIACFGFLDSPARLLEGYIYLAVCYSQLRDNDKARFYVQEIRRLKLDWRLAGTGLPEDVAKRFADLSAKIR